MHVWVGVIAQGSFNFLFWGDQTMQIYNNAMISVTTSSSVIASGRTCGVSKAVIAAAATKGGRPIRYNLTSR